MTTIAANTDTIACDLQFTYGGSTKMKGSSKILSLTGEVPQKMFGVEKCFIGFAGDAGKWGEVVSWYYDDPFANKVPKTGDIEFLMLTSKHQLFHSNNLKNWMLLPEKQFAIGTGGSFALAAMSAGKTPGDAVKIASRHDLYTGMGCKIYHI